MLKSRSAIRRNRFPLVAGAICSLAHAAAQDENRLKNPGAEQVSAEDKSRPAEWFTAWVPAEGLTMRLDDKVVKSGKASMFVGNTHAYKQATFNNWAQRVEGVPEGATFSVSGWVKTESAEGVTVSFQAWDAAGTNLVAFASTEPVTGTRDWHHVKSPPITIPASAKTIIVRAGLGGKGKAWFDDLRLAAGEASRLPKPPEEAGANLMANPGAEDVDTKVPSDPAVWFKAHIPAEGLVMLRITAGARAGNAALHIANTHRYDQAVSNNWAQAIPFDLEGRIVRLSGWVKTEEAESVTLCVQGFTDLVNMSSFGSTEVIKGTQGWTRVETKPVRIGKGVTTTTVRAVLTGTGKVWFDDLVLELVNEQPEAE